MKDDFWDRVFARAERKEAIKAKIRADVKAKVDKQRAGIQTATALWNSAVQANLDSGMSRPKAVQTANRENPGLRYRFVQEANTKH
jgi:hypothetical protein